MATYKDAFPSSITPEGLARILGRKLDLGDFCQITPFTVSHYPEQTKKGIRWHLCEYEDAIREFNKIAANFDYVVSVTENPSKVSGGSYSYYMIRAIGVNLSKKLGE